MPENQTQERLKARIQQVRDGGMREYWLQEYVKERYRELGFSEMSYVNKKDFDFIGVKDGRKVTIEAERMPANFVKHGHNKDKVDILMIMTTDDTPKDLLPETIIQVDPEDLVKKTYDARKDYAIKKQAERKVEEAFFEDSRLAHQIAHSLRLLRDLLFEVESSEYTPEDDQMSHAAFNIALLYISTYNLDKVEEGDGILVPKVVAIANCVAKRGIEAVSMQEKEHLMLWLDLFNDDYIASI